MTPDGTVEPPASTQTRELMLWLPTASGNLMSLLVAVVVNHGRSLGLEVAVVEIHDLWLTTPQVVVTGERRAVGRFESDVLRGCAYLETGGQADIDTQLQPEKFAHAFACWLAQQPNLSLVNPAT